MKHFHILAFTAHTADVKTEQQSRPYRSIRNSHWHLHKIKTHIAWYRVDARMPLISLDLIIPHFLTFILQLCEEEARGFFPALSWKGSLTFVAISLFNCLKHTHTHFLFSFAAINSQLYLLIFVVAGGSILNFFFAVCFASFISLRAQQQQRHEATLFAYSLGVDGSDSDSFQLKNFFFYSRYYIYSLTGVAWREFDEKKWASRITRSHERERRRSDVEKQNNRGKWIFHRTRVDCFSIIFLSLSAASSVSFFFLLWKFSTFFFLHLTQGSTRMFSENRATKFPSIFHLVWAPTGEDEISVTTCTFSGFYWIFQLSFQSPESSAHVNFQAVGVSLACDERVREENCAQRLRRWWKL